MKKIFLVVIMLIVMVGCVGALMQVDRSSLEPTQEKMAGIGDVLFEHTEETVNKVGTAEHPQAGGRRFDLTVVELNDQKVGIQYSEYTRLITYSQTPFGPMANVSGWSIKDGFNKRFDYQISDRVIRFRGYEFEILAVEDGRIKYRRTK